MGSQDETELKAKTSGGADVSSTESSKSTKSGESADPKSASASPESVDSPSALLNELEEARKKAAENWDLFLRTRADVDNSRRRAQIDVENAHKYGTEKFARELLGVMDSLEHGLAAVDTGNAQSLREGLELTHKLLLDTLEKHGIHPINPIGEVFDPKFQEALTTQVSQELEPNKVMSVVQKGYMLHDRLLRPARVVVSRAE